MGCRPSVDVAELMGADGGAIACVPHLSFDVDRLPLRTPCARRRTLGRHEHRPAACASHGVPLSAHPLNVLPGKVERVSRSCPAILGRWHIAPRRLTDSQSRRQPSEQPPPEQAGKSKRSQQSEAAGHGAVRAMRSAALRKRGMIWRRAMGELMALVPGVPIEPSLKVSARVAATACRAPV